MKIISMLKLKKWSLEGAKLMAVFSIDLPGRVKILNCQEQNH